MLTFIYYIALKVWLQVKGMPYKKCPEQGSQVSWEHIERNQFQYILLFLHLVLIIIDIMYKSTLTYLSFF